MKVDKDYCYTDYVKFIENYREYAIRWAFKSIPDPDEEYKIVGIHKDISGHHKAIDRACEYVFVVESRNDQLFLVGDQGIREV